VYQGSERGQQRRGLKNAESVCERGRAYFQLKGSSAHGFTLDRARPEPRGGKKD